MTARLSPQREAEIRARLAEARSMAAEADWPLEEYQAIRQQQADAAVLLAELAAVRADAQRALDLLMSGNGYEAARLLDSMTGTEVAS